MSLERKTALKRTPFVQKEPAQRKLKPKKCRICAKEYQPVSSTSKVCSVECAQGLLKKMATTQITRQRRKERAQDKLKLKTRADYFREAQAALNKWIREVRDAGKPCISCGHTDHGQKFDAGHFITRGSRPNLALEENNLARQCHWCNVHLSGNQILFRKGLVARIGLEAVESLEADQTPRKYTIEQLQAIKADYMARIRKAKKENS
jgi:hypothetical protein